MYFAVVVVVKLCCSEVPGILILERGHMCVCVCCEWFQEGARQFKNKGKGLEEPPNTQVNGTKERGTRDGG